MSPLSPYRPAPHVSQFWQVRKPKARGRRGVVVAQAHAAANVGVDVLDAGGNAVDAAVAAAFALAAVEPWNSGLGGVGFALVHSAGDARATLVNFGPVAPLSIDPSWFRLTGRNTADLFGWPEVEGDANIHGPLSFATPSAVEGYRAMHARWGRMPMNELLAPALALARRGLAQDWFSTLMIAGSASTLRLYSESARIYLPGGSPRIPSYGADPGFFRLGELAQTLEQLQRAGLRDFYDGDVAASIATDVASLAGTLSRADLSACSAWLEPAGECAWDGRVLQYAAGLTAGPTLARVLSRMLKASGKVPDAAWYVALAREMQTAYGERLERPGEAVISGPEGCTTHLTVCDAEGGVVALTLTLLSSMGSKVVLPGTGVLMNNGVMWFDPRPDSPNAIAPGKRPLTNMCPIIVADAGRPILAGGASGGRRIMAAVIQMLAFVHAFGMDPEEAAQYPRIDVSGPEGLLADNRLPAHILAALAATGRADVVEHVVFPINFACPSLISLEADGRRIGVSDGMSPWSAALAQL